MKILNRIREIGIVELYFRFKPIQLLNILITALVIILYSFVSKPDVYYKSYETKEKIKITKNKVIEYEKELQKLDKKSKDNYVLEIKSNVQKLNEELNQIDKVFSFNKYRILTILGVVLLIVLIIIRIYYESYQNRNKIKYLNRYLYWAMAILFISPLTAHLNSILLLIAVSIFLICFIIMIAGLFDIGMEVEENIDENLIKKETYWIMQIKMGLNLFIIILVILIPLLIPKFPTYGRTVREMERIEKEVINSSEIKGLSIIESSEKTINE